MTMSVRAVHRTPLPLLFISFLQIIQCLEEPIIYTYFERLPLDQRYTDMSDNDDDLLLQHWQSAWKTAGWNPIVLGREHTKSYVNYQRYEDEIQSLNLDALGQVLFRRYLAMASIQAKDGRVSWMCDYDVFPLRDFRNKSLTDQKNLVIYDVVSPTLAYSRDWKRILQDLLEDAKVHHKENSQQLNFWTDTLGMYSFLRNDSITSHRLVMPAQFLIAQESLSDPAYCKERKFRKQFVAVHFSPRAMLEGVDSTRRRSRYRGEVGIEKTLQFAKLCNITLKEY